jgi:hypothetical protein
LPARGTGKLQYIELLYLVGCSPAACRKCLHHEECSWRGP